ncbi:hypothetical protein [Actinoplanes sp. NPDC051851]|uniref:hypothetical protein n=1 Tax=Actinoplanes sp. NPDC051851 TaxID=3154753 RepID=UPI00343F5DA0
MSATFGETRYETDRRAPVIAPRQPPGPAPAPPPGRPERPTTPIVLVGPAGGGKTTLLSAILHGGPDTDVYGEWRAIPPSHGSALVDELYESAEDRRFPEATVEAGSETWTVRGEYRDRTRRGLLGRTTVERGERVEFDLAVVDPPGGDLLSPGSTGILDVLCRSRGIILLVDPTKMLREAVAQQTDPAAELVPTFKYFNRLLRGLDSRLAEQGAAGRLPHHLSVCVSKFDDPMVYAAAKSLDLVDRNAGRQPTVPSGDPAAIFFGDLCRRSVEPNDARIPEMVTRYFRPERTRYHVVSAIGFYVDPEHDFDEEDFLNVVVEGRAKRIRNQNPVNVWETLIELYESIRTEH